VAYDLAALQALGLPPEYLAALAPQLAAQEQAQQNFGALDPVPAQDPAYQLFMRNSGAQESEIMDEIKYRTEQNSREINRRAAGFAAQKADAEANATASKEQGAQKITQDFADRGFGGAATARDQQLGTLTGNIDRSTQQQIGNIDQQQLEQTASSRDALAGAIRSLGSDAASLYRKRADEELAARNRIAQRQLETTYGTGSNATYF
jgi:hypothetical protein